MISAPHDDPRSPHRHLMPPCSGASPPVLLLLFHLQPPVFLLFFVLQIGALAVEPVHDQESGPEKNRENRANELLKVGISEHDQSVAESRIGLAAMAAAAIRPQGLVGVARASSL